jgi:predicted dehydrogenase
MAGERARVGVIGTGWWSTFAHLPSLSSYRDADLIGVADVDLAKAQQAAGRFDVPRAFGDHRALLDLKPDGVVVATPHHTHYQLVKDALDANCDVMVEKPMVVDPAHGRELVAIAKERSRNLHIGYPYPYTRHNRLLRETIAACELGEILFATSLFATSVLDFYRGHTEMTGNRETMWGPGKDTYSDPARGGGQMLTQVTHSSSLLFHLTGMRPSSVHAFTDTYDVKVDVWDAVAFRTSSGAAGTVASTGTVPFTQKTIEEIRIFGSAGHVQIDTSRGTLTIHRNDGSIQEEPPLTDEERYPMYQTSRQLVDTILGRSPVLVGGELGLLTVEFLAAALESAKTGQTVTLNQ